MKTKIYTLVAALVLVATQNVFAQHATTHGSPIAGASDCSTGTDSVHLYTPRAVCVDGSGNVYVADNSNNRIQKWALGAKYGTTVMGQKNGKSGNDSLHLQGPEDIFVDSKGNLYEADYWNARIQKWSATSKTITTVAGNKHAIGGGDSTYLNGPAGVFVDAAGNIYVADAANNRIQKWAPGAKYGTTVAGDKNGKSGSDSAHLSNPRGVTVDGTGNIYVADGSNNRIQKWAPGAKYGVTVAGDKNGNKGSDSTHLNFPSKVFLDKYNNLFIADVKNQRIQEWIYGKTSGKTMAGQTSILGSDSAHFKEPWGVTLDVNGNIYVADANNNRVVKWKELGYSTLDLTHITGFNLYPNPATRQFTLDMATANTKDKAHIQILNLLGQPVDEQIVPNANGKVHTTFSTLALPAGVYLVKVVIGGESVVTKLLKN